MVAPLDNEDDVRIKIVIEAQQALEELKVTTAAVNTFGEKVDLVVAKASELATKYNTATYSVARGFQDLNKVMDVGFDTQILNKAVSDTKKLGEEAENTAFKFNVLRTVLGTLTALAVFQVLQVFFQLGQAFVDAQEKADKLVRAVVDMKNIERILSLQGVKVSMQDLFEIVDKLENEFKLLSKTDLTDLVSQAAIATREFGFTLDQIEQVSRVAAALAETQKISAKEALDAVVRSLSGRSQGNQILKQSGIFLTEEEIKLRAVSLGLAQNTKEVSQAATAQAVLNLEMEKTKGLLSEVGDLENSEAGQVAKATTAWDNLLTSLGTGTYGLYAQIAEGIANILNFVTMGINGAKLLAAVFLSSNAAVIVSITELFKGNLDVIGNYIKAFKSAYVVEIQSMFKTPINDAVGRDFINPYIQSADTATNVTASLGNAFEMTAEQSDKAAEALQQMDEKLQKLGERENQLTDKFNTETARNAEDFATKQAREYEDYQHSVLLLNQDTNEKLANAQRKQRERELNDEAKFQEKMLELREKFLFDLEDALHERDARQVLRLIRQYELDKDQAIRQHALEKKDRAIQNAEELADIRQQAQDKLAELTYEYETRKQREIEDNQERERRRTEDYQKELSQLEAQRVAIIQETANKLAEILNLNGQGADAVFKLLNAYYGPNQVFDTLFDNSYKSLVAKTQALVAQLNQIAANAANQASATASSSATAPSTTTSSGGGGGNHTANAHPFASGGVAVANKPTNVVFGENPELAFFAPLSQLSSLFGGQSNGAGGGRSGGKLELEITLSDGLEQKIVDKSMDAFTEVVTTVKRNRN